MMKIKLLFLLLSLLFHLTIVSAQEAEKSELQQRAESEGKKGNVAGERYHYIRAFEDYVNKGKMQQGVECGIKATALYYKENYYKEAFDLLHRIDQSISDKGKSSKEEAALNYLTSKERLQMYVRLRKAESAREQLKVMESQANVAGDDDVKNDLLYNKALFYYNMGQTAQGNAIFKEMAGKLTSQKEYSKVDEVYQTLIANGRRSNNASLVAQSYASYLAWKDSVAEQKLLDETGALKKQIAINEADIQEKDSSLASRRWIIVGLCILAGALAAVLAVGAVVLLCYILLTRKQKKTIKMVNENNALKAKFISNISAQLSPALQPLDSRIPEVRALKDFSDHIQTLSSLECSAGESVETESIMVVPFCEGLIDQIRDKVRSGVALHVNAPKMSADINKEYVSHILLHLLTNAAEYTPADGSIWLDFKKRGAHTFQFLVSNTGEPIAEEKREDVFKPFLEIRDLTKGDGLGLPICKQMAVKMNGDLSIDGEFTKGTRFVLELHN